MGIKLFTGKRPKQILAGGVLATAILSACCWYVHLPFDRQIRNYDRFGVLIYPIEYLGEAATQFTDILGITGDDVQIPLSTEPNHRGEKLCAGKPEGSMPTTLLDNKGFMVGYSDTRKVPLWVAYRVFSVDSMNSPPRPSRFTTDKRTIAKVGHKDYTGSGYDRGHMAPNYAIATRFGKSGQKETFLMSNIVPQKPDLNRYAWRELEHKIAEYYGNDCEEVWVLTGPIFDETDTILPSGVHIPDAFYKIVVDVTNGKLRVMPFIFLQDSPKHVWMRRHLVTVDQIESLTGLDFFPNLSDAEETILESGMPTRLWRPSMRQIFHMIWKKR